MISVKTTPDTPISDSSPADRIVNGNPGKSMIHRVGSAKQYTTKGLGRVCNQAKFPMGGKTAQRKKG
jgi:hypothetical protein